MPEVISAIVMLLLILSPRLSVSGGSLSLLRKVRVSKSVVAVRPWTTLPVPSGTSSTLRCSNFCSFWEWCDLWCLDASENLCLFSDLIVMPGYVETNTADALECYTRRRKDLATGASIQAVPKGPNHPLRVASMLVDGIYKVDDLDWCYKSIHIDVPWLVLDFGAPVKLQRLEIFLQTSGDLGWVEKFENIEVRTGMLAVDTLGDFSSYELFGKFRGPAIAFSQVVVFEVVKAVTAQYISVQKMDKATSIQLCHIEVF